MNNRKVGEKMSVRDVYIHPAGKEGGVQSAIVSPVLYGNI